jgi:hypothetical protein
MEIFKYTLALITTLNNPIYFTQGLVFMNLITWMSHGRSRVISYHSRDIGVACLLFCNHYKDDGQGHVQYHDLEVYPVCFVKS